MAASAWKEHGAASRTISIVRQSNFFKMRGRKVLSGQHDRVGESTPSSRSAVGSAKSSTFSTASPSPSASPSNSTASRETARALRRNADWAKSSRVLFSFVSTRVPFGGPKTFLSRLSAMWMKWILGRLASERALARKVESDTVRRSRILTPSRIACGSPPNSREA